MSMSIDRIRSVPFVPDLCFSGHVSRAKRRVYDLINAINRYAHVRRNRHRAVMLILGTCLCVSSVLADQGDIRPIRNCGAQCALMLCRYFQVNVQEEQLQKYLGPQDKGTVSLHELKECFQALGFDSLAFQGDSEDLKKSVHPIILHFRPVRNEKVGHFLVVMMDFKRGQLVAYDPSFAGRPIDLDDKTLQRYWTGKGLMVWPRYANHLPQERFPGSLWLSALASVFCGAVFTHLLTFRSQKGIFFVPLLVWAAGLCYAEAKPSALPTVKPEKEVNLGMLPEGRNEVQYDFSWRNPYSETLTIQRISKSCGCEVVRPSAMQIPPQGDLKLHLYVDAAKWNGQAAVSFVVFFTKSSIQPRLFTLNFFRPKSLQADPPTVDFQTVDDPSTAIRSFRFAWVSDKTQKNVHIEESKITCNRDLLRCRFLKTTTREFRLPNAAAVTREQAFFYEVRTAPGIREGEFHDTISIPVQIGDDRRVLRVPVAGYVPKQITAQPSKIIAFLSPDKIQTAKWLVSLVARKDMKAPENTVVSGIEYDRSKLSVVALTRPQMKDGNIIQTLQISLNKNAAGDSVKTAIHLLCQVGKEKVNLDIPVKVIVATRK